MAYSSTNPARLIAGGGLPNGSIYAYYIASTEDSSDIAVTGYFAGCGYQSRGNNNIGMRKGDIVFTIASTGATQPSECVAHAVIGSTIDQATTAAATAFNYSFDVTISAT